jgi:hypothetical protein
VHALDD